MEIKEALVKLFTDDPVNWIKWVVVFFTLIGGYVVALPLYQRVSYFISWDRKRDIAKGRGHVIDAVLVKKYPHGEVGKYNWSATYRYTFENKEKEYYAYFKEPSSPPFHLYLYYLNNPRKLFSVQEYHYENHKAILLFPIMFLPWILAVLVAFVLNIPFSNM